MALRIVNNLAAMNTQRWLGVADAGMKKSLERLSSGYRINKAADDAAGLAISQSFRAEIASFSVAYRNTSEASSLLQVAEGGMDQIGNMLTRLKELATQAASGNIGDNIEKVSAEANELIEEINRIANSTKYGGASLLVGEAGTVVYTAGSFTSGGDMNGKIGTIKSAGDEWFGLTSSEQATITGVTSGTLGAFFDTIDDATDNVWTLDANGTGATMDVSNADGVTFIGTIDSVTQLTIAGMGDAGGDIVLTTAGATSATLDLLTFTLDASGLDDDNVTIGTSAANGSYSFTADAAGTVTLQYVTGGAGTLVESVTGAAADATLNFSTLGISVVLGDLYDAGDLLELELTVAGAASSTSGTSTNKSYSFQIGAENNTNNQLDVSVSSVLATNLDVGLISDLLSTTALAKDALDNIDDAISALSTTRGNLGAAQNRVNYAGANLLTVIENVQAAESVIRDVDMASEMTYFTKNQILLQAGTAMLAQANMAPQQVLALFG